MLKCYTIAKKNIIRAVKRQLKVSKLIKINIYEVNKLKCVSVDREARLRQRYPAVKGCTKKRSSDFEDISMGTVSKVVSVICKPLARYCKFSFRTGVFLSRMKIAKVIQMFKSGTKTDVTNYRSTSFLPQFSKILEKLFLTRINSFLSANNILSSSQ